MITELDRRLVHSQARRYLGRGLEYEDLVQEGLIATLRAHETYREDTGAYSTWAVICIRRQILRALADYRCIRIPENTWRKGGQFPAVVHFDEGWWLRVRAPEEERDGIKARRVAKYVDRLSERERRVIEGIYCDERTCADIAKDFGCTRQWVDRLHHEALWKMRQWAKADEEKAAA